MKARENGNAFLIKAAGIYGGGTKKGVVNCTRRLWCSGKAS